MDLPLIPPFPGAKVTRFEPMPGSAPPSEALIAEAAALATELRVDGEYWAPRAGASSAATFPHAVLQSPFDGSPLPLLDAIRLCGEWRRLIEANRDLVAGIGFGRWKQPTVAPLLWNGAAPLPFLSAPPEGRPSGTLAVWQARSSAAALRQIAEGGWPTVEVEDGFLRSQGLGADCVPPLSITLDAKGAYFDPAQPSELEDLLASAKFDDHLLDRARRLIATIRDRGLGKYASGTTPYPRSGGERRHLLVPGQVEDDRSVRSGGYGLTNLALLQAVRAARPDAFLIYKPHPDVEAGHRQGAIPRDAALAQADVVETTAGMASLLAACDEIHVITSQAGFEGLLHGKEVWTHGVPFYAGWGLTRDLGPVPARRTRHLSLEQLVAATLILYPRYLDPHSGLPCPVEVAVDRLSGPPMMKDGLLVRARRLQGRVRQQLRVLAG